MRLQFRLRSVLPLLLLLAAIHGAADALAQDRADGANPFEPERRSSSESPWLVAQKECGASGGETPKQTTGGGTLNGTKEKKDDGVKKEGGGKAEGDKPPGGQKQDGGGSGGPRTTCGSSGGTGTGGGGTRTRPPGGGNLDYDDAGTGAGGAPPAGPQGPVISDRLDGLASMVCRNGAKRNRGDPVDISWQRMAKPADPQITTSSDADYGSCFEEGSSEAARNFRNGLKAARKGVSRVGGPAGAAAGGAMRVGELGMQAAEACIGFGERFADRQNQRIVNVTVRIPMMTATLKCQQQEICRDGRWEPGPTEPVPGTLQTPDASDGVSTQEGVLGPEVPGSIRRAFNRYRAEYNRLEAFLRDPCLGDRPAGGAGGGAGSGGGGPTIAGGGAGGAAPRNCQPILDEIRAKDPVLAQTIDAHDTAQRRVSELETQLREAETARNRDLQAIDEQIRAAEREMSAAEKEASDFESNIENTARTDEGAQRMRELLQRSDRRVSAARSALRNLRQQRQDLESRHAETRLRLSRERDAARSEQQRLAAERDRLQAEIDALWQRYRDCQAGR